MSVRGGVCVERERERDILWICLFESEGVKKVEKRVNEWGEKMMIKLVVIFHVTVYFSPHLFLCFATCFVTTVQLRWPAAPGIVITYALLSSMSSYSRGVFPWPILCMRPMLSIEFRFQNFHFLSGCSERFLHFCIAMVCILCWLSDSVLSQEV